MFRLKSRLGKGCLFLAILLFSTIVTTIFTSGSTSASQDDIRIGLMMNQSTSSIVTLTSETGLTLGGESGALLNIGDASSLRVSLDQFFIVASETKDISGARTISQTLSQHSFPNVIVQQKKNNETVYRVIASMGATQEEAQKRLQEIRSKAAANATLAGAHRVLAGSFATLEEANARLGQIQAQDYYAYLAQVRTGTALSYQVWVGDGASATEQSTLQNQLQQAFPQITFAPAQADEYILHTSSYLEGNQSGVPYYLTRKKITISPKSVSGKTPLITISEKQNRKYRGQMEISQHNQRFALVNVLPLEHYLYGVVGSELGDSWPIETLKAQAVLARNYAFMGRQANKYGIAHLSDTTADQAYYGFNVEGQNIRNAVDATKGEVLTHNGQVFSTFYYSNAGGMTADGREVWGTAVPTHKVVSSKDSHPADVAATWYRFKIRQEK
ncbi:SpoIID/LytB domain-containing protein [Caldalkalibacillus mannanilyticus]|uniref:SpoIID/LytB domain-containing protein n=1 Tax=Caldalkalibacillus mannanilyticus TaxID=1418 RepID=UPI0004681D8B|nr:SpoIID/LytB domain-containing protein [Caldalkalibacillus mannanilyticus]